MTNTVSAYRIIFIITKDKFEFNKVEMILVKKVVFCKTCKMEAEKIWQSCQEPMEEEILFGFTEAGEAR